ncbi:MAG: flagellar biosynthetic protein FliR [Phycisphaerae bacterium]|jgi:flagellar biosynthetic protein FliR
MPIELFAIYQKLPVFALVLGRIGAMLLALPIIAGLAVPIRVRALLAVGLALVAAPVVPVPVERVASLPAVGVALVGELLLGALIGLIVRCCFVGMELGGLLISQESGLAFGAIADPNSGLEQSVISVAYAQIAAVVFLLTGGHRAVVAATLDSFHGVPLAETFALLPAGTELALRALELGGGLAVRVAAPVVLTLFLINVALGFISRTVPQLNVTTIGFSVKTLLACLLLAAALPAASEAFGDALSVTLDGISGLLAPAPAQDG